MVIIIGTIGFICGFFLGQIILLAMLKDVSKERLVNDKALRWKYGSLNWLIAVTTAASAVWLYNEFMLRP